MKITNVAVIGVFVAFLTAPIASLMLMGPDDAAERKVTWPDLTRPGILSPRDTYRNDLARRLVSNSPVGMAAIRTKSDIDLHVFQRVNTPQVISGVDDWLFYKPSFLGGNCIPENDMDVALARSAAMRDIAKAMDIDYQVSVSPDKETVYPEKLGLAEVAAGCKTASSRLWRRKTAEANSAVIDHLKVMDHNPSDALLYFKTDTHWNELGKTRALRQLANIYLGRDVPAPKGPSGEKSKTTDIVRNMLRLGDREPYSTYDSYWDKDFATAVGARIPGAVIVHDSFYLAAQQGLNKLFKDPVFINYNSPTFDDDTKAAVAKKPKYILVNSVERSFFSRTLGNELSWRRGIGAALLTENAEAAKKCKMTEVMEAEFISTDMNASGGGHLKSGDDPQIVVFLPNGGKPCLRISFRTPSSSASALYLPVLDKKTSKDRFMSGMTVDFADTSENRDLWIVLPEDYAGRRVRIDPINEAGEISDFRVYTGTL